MSSTLIFSLFYILLSGCVLYPPNEFISAGLTIESIFGGWLGSENAHFVQYHIKRSVLTLFIHSLLPLAYVLGMFMTTYEGIYAIFTISYFFQILCYLAFIFPLIILFIINLWAQSNWEQHPICQNLNHFSNNDQTWLDVAASINIEFRRIDKICIQINAVSKVVATENWILKVTPYTIKCAHQSDTALIVCKSDTHEISQQSHGEIQFIDIEVKSVRNGVKPFTVRLNALDFKDLQDRIARPIAILPNVTFHKTLLERFVDVFKQQVEQNPKFRTNQELENCIGCMQVLSNVKLQKNCEDVPSDENSCMSCHCRPMWCVDCMAKWFASRQNENESDRWLSSKCTCPLCRCKFCILDVSLIEQI